MSWKDSPISYIAIVILIIIIIYYVGGQSFNLSLPQMLLIIIIIALVYLGYRQFFMKK